MPTPLNDDRQFGHILQWLNQKTGLDCQFYKINYLKRRLAIRLRATNSNNYGEYYDVLRREPEEYKILLDRLTIHVSHFFRDAAVYKCFGRLVLPELKKRERIRIWSAGCANGEEPYSLAMLFYELKLLGKPLSILATDIDQTCLTRAREGIYKESALQEVSPEMRRRFFQGSGDRWQVVSTLRELVTFEANDMTGALPAGPFDLIVCRNVMIYFTSPLQSQLMTRFHDLLRPNGYLILGKTEVLLSEYRSRYRSVNLEERIYQRQEMPPAED
ncbi:MAG: protein-glutamate O-methyltransferase CheR [Candidatus Firestonebacteria bacterium]|nr:protein-glutamate O-methyltransferase CheR [Candidatus Firestonebacteria bacterium]